MPGEDSLHFQLVLGSKRGNFHALAGRRIEPPAVVTALHYLAVDSTVGKRNPPVRTRILQRKGFSFCCAPQHQRHFQQERLDDFLRANLRAPRGRVPKIIKALLLEEPLVLGRTAEDRKST